MRGQLFHTSYASSCQSRKNTLVTCMRQSSALTGRALMLMQEHRNTCIHNAQVFITVMREEVIWTNMAAAMVSARAHPMRSISAR